jgi:hypothetical protein
MTLTASAATFADRVTRRFGYRVFPEWALYRSQIQEIESLEKTESPSAAPIYGVDYLRRDNPRLIELRKLYAALDDALKTPLVWKEKSAEGDIASFRGHNMWVYQRGAPEFSERAHLLASYYILANDRLGLMRKFTEDGVFGAVTFEAAGRRVSRDMLDSILEIDFLDRHLHISSRPDTSLLDIGAGYGRLAHRMLTAFPALRSYLCTDAIPESSFVCEFYLRFRGFENRFKLVLPTEIDQALESAKVDVAINISSFSECTLAAVRWWLNRLAAHKVRYFMIVPNSGNHRGQLLRNNVGDDMLSLIEQSGYRLIAREPKYADPAVQNMALAPTCYWLFEHAVQV